MPVVQVRGMLMSMAHFFMSMDVTSMPNPAPRYSNAASKIGGTSPIRAFAAGRLMPYKAAAKMATRVADAGLRWIGPSP